MRVGRDSGSCPGSSWTVRGRWGGATPGPGGKHAEARWGEGCCREGQEQQVDGTQTGEEGESRRGVWSDREGGNRRDTEKDNKMDKVQALVTQHGGGRSGEAGKQPQLSTRNKRPQGSLTGTGVSHIRPKKAALCLF